MSTGETPTDTRASLSAFKALLSHEGTRVIGALKDDRIVSMATLHILPNMTNGARAYALIENVATLPGFTRQGFGRAVMQSAIDTAWTAGAYKIMLLTGRRNDALKFYQKLGFDAGDKHALVLRHEF
nr:GNAT family N-acetyltransferase [Sulfitobacter aestuariivivens]